MKNIHTIFDKTFLVLFGLLLFLTPLIMYDKTSELFEFNKLLFIYFMTLTIVCVWIVKMILHRKFIFTNTILSIPLLVFLFSQILSTIFSIDSHTSLYGYYGRFNGGLLSTVSYILLYFAAVSNLSFPAVKNLLKISLGSALFVFLWGLPSHFGHDPTCFLFTHQFTDACWTDQFRPQDRIFSTLGQPNWLGAYLAAHTFMGLYFSFETFAVKKVEMMNIQFVRYWYLFLSTLFFIGVLLSRSRSALGAVLIGFLITGIYLLIKKRMQFLIVTAVLLLLSVVIFKTGIDKIDHIMTLSQTKTSSLPTQSVSVSEPFSNVTDSLAIRRIVWQGAISLGLQYPLVGTGVETFAYAYNFVRPQAHNLTSEWDFIYNKAHNEFLNYFATSGFLGLLSYLALIGFVGYVFYVQLVQKKQDESIVFVAAYATILVTNFFGFSTTTISLLFYLIPALVIIDLNHIHKPEDKVLNLTIFSYLGFAIIFLFFFIGTFSIAQYLTADVSYAKGNNDIAAQDYVSAYQDISKAETLRHEHVYEDKLSSVLASLAFISAYQSGKTPDISQLNEFYKKSEEYSNMSLTASPLNVYYYKTKAKNEYIFYQMTSRDAFLMNAVQTLQKAKEIAPTDPRFDYTIAIFYMSRLDAEKDKTSDAAIILQSLNRALALKPNYRDALYEKGLYYKKMGQTGDAQDIFQKLVTNDPQDKEAQKQLISQ